MSAINLLNNYDVLRPLKPQFLETIKIASVFGYYAREVIIVTKDNNVYSFGENKYGCLGLGHNNVVQEPIIVNELSNKGVHKFSFGASHVLALTNSGKVYAWGYNSWGQLGNGNTRDSNRPQIIAGLVEKNVVDICCGGFHSLALTESGELFSWGANDYRQVGHGFDGNQLLPIAVHGLEHQNIVGIACGFSHSVALARNGNVFAWGYNAFGQLGTGDTDIQNIPIHIIPGNNELIRKVVCGRNHTLLLSITGDIFGFGYNLYGQIGSYDSKSINSSTDSSGESLIELIPNKIEDKHKFIDIEASIFYDITVAISTKDLKCSVWGKHVANYPKPTEFDSFYETYADYLTTNITHKPIYVTSKPYIGESFRKHFNNAKCSDFKLNIDNKYIYCHKLILDLRCDFFRSLFTHNWSDNASQSQIECNDFPYIVYYIFIKYLYTDIVESRSIAADHAIQLLALSDHYCEQELKLLCQQIIINNNCVNVDNVCALYSSAKKYNAKQLKQYCYLFILNNFNLVRKTDSFDESDEDLSEHMLVRSKSRSKSLQEKNGV